MFYTLLDPPKIFPVFVAKQRALKSFKIIIPIGCPIFDFVDVCVNPPFLTRNCEEHVSHPSQVWPMLFELGHWGVNDPANELARSDKWLKWGKEIIKPFGRIAISKHSQRLADLPVPGEQLVELADWAFRNPAQHIGEPRLRIDIGESAGLDSENTYPSIFVNRLI